MLYKQLSWNSGPNLKPLHTFEGGDKITGMLHSGTAFDIEKHLFVFDERNFYVLKMKPDSITVHENVYCIGL